MDLVWILDGIVQRVNCKDSPCSQQHTSHNSQQSIAGRCGTDRDRGCRGRLRDHHAGAGLFFGQAHLFIVGYQGGIDTAILGQAGLEFEQRSLIGCGDNGSVGGRDLLVHVGNLFLQAIQASGITLRLELDDAIGKNRGDGVGNIGGPRRIGISYTDDQQLRIGDDIHSNGLVEF